MSSSENISWSWSYLPSSEVVKVYLGQNDVPVFSDVKFKVKFGSLDIFHHDNQLMFKSPGLQNLLVMIEKLCQQ